MKPAPHDRQRCRLCAADDLAREVRRAMDTKRDPDGKVRQALIRYEALAQKSSS